MTPVPSYCEAATGLQELHSLWSWSLRRMDAGLRWFGYKCELDNRTDVRWCEYEPKGPILRIFWAIRRSGGYRCNHEAS